VVPLLIKPPKVLQYSQRWKRESITSGLSSIFNATVGIVFLGTPHTASSAASWLNYVQLVSGGAYSVDSSLVKDVLQDFQESAVAFRELLDQRQIKIVSFYETKPTSTNQGLVKVRQRPSLLCT